MKTCNSLAKNSKSSTQEKSLYRPCKSSVMRGKSYCSQHQPIHNGITSLQYKALQSFLNSARQNKSVSNKAINNILNNMSTRIGTGIHNNQIRQLINSERKKSVHYKEEQIKKQRLLFYGKVLLNNLPDLSHNQFNYLFKDILMFSRDNKKEITIYLSMDKVPFNIIRQIKNNSTVFPTHIIVNDNIYIINCPVVLHGLLKNLPSIPTSKIQIHNLETTGNGRDITCSVTFTNMGRSTQTYKGYIKLSQETINRISYFMTVDAIKNSTIMSPLHNYTSLKFK